MGKMTKAQARKRLEEAKTKVAKVWAFGPMKDYASPIVSFNDMAAIEKIINKCLKRIK